MDDTSLTILLVEDNPGDARLLEEGLTEVAGDTFRLIWVQDLSTALERISTELLDAVILDLNLPDSDGFETFTRVRAASSNLPVLVLTGIEDDQLGLRAIQQGAQDYLSKSDVVGSKIARSLRYAVERHRSRQRDAGHMRTAARGKVIGFCGVKGGVGTTTVMLNAAGLLARNTQRSVTAAELRGDFGSFAAQLHEAPAHTLATLVRMDPATVTETVLDKCLVRSRFGFDVLFSAQDPEEFSPIGAETVRSLIERLSRRTVYTLLDLPPIAYPISAAAIPACDFLALLTERDPSSVAAAHVAMRMLRRANVPPVGLIVVNRSLMLDGSTPRQIETALGFDLLGVVPPAPEVSLSAQRAGTPIALHRPLSAPASMLTAITERIARAVSEPGVPAPPREAVSVA